MAVWSLKFFCFKILLQGKQKDGKMKSFPLSLSLSLDETATQIFGQKVFMPQHYWDGP